MVYIMHAAGLFNQLANANFLAVALVCDVMLIRFFLCCSYVCLIIGERCLQQPIPLHAAYPVQLVLAPGSAVSLSTDALGHARVSTAGRQGAG